MAANAARSPRSSGCGWHRAGCSALHQHERWPRHSRRTPVTRFATRHCEQRREAPHPGYRAVDDLSGTPVGDRNDGYSPFYREYKVVALRIPCPLYDSRIIRGAMTTRCRTGYHGEVARRDLMNLMHERSTVTPGSGSRVGVSVTSWFQPRSRGLAFMIQAGHEGQPSGSTRS